LVRKGAAGWEIRFRVQARASARNCAYRRIDRRIVHPSMAAADRAADAGDGHPDCAKARDRLASHDDADIIEIEPLVARGERNCADAVPVVTRAGALRSKAPQF
jgi:hypothetical protein